MQDTFTIVAFRYDSKYSILYAASTEVIDITAAVAKALEDINTDVISIRRVRRATSQ